MKRLILILFLGPLLLFSQEIGVHFMKDIDWQGVKAKAKIEDKYIFVDCYTTWCGPCIYMAQNIFPQEKVGEFFNKNFVSLKIQMDQTKMDKEEVRSWYDEAKRFESDYAVVAYPTFLIFNPDGELVHRIVGGGEADDFIALAKKGLDPETQFVTLVNRYKMAPNDASLALKMAIAANAAYDNELADEAFSNYIHLAGIDGLFTKENIQQVLPAISSIKSPTFAIFSTNQDRAEAVLIDLKVTYTVNDILAQVVVNDIVIPQLFGSSNTAIDFEEMAKQLKTDYPNIALDKYFLLSKSEYYMVKMNWPAFVGVVEEFESMYKNDVSPEVLNQFARSLLYSCDDLDYLKVAITWSKRALKSKEDAAYLDTYANLLYKIGDNKNAIIWQEKAVMSASEGEKMEFSERLAKMKTGISMWE